jgi:class 3 adenylate cyclase/predicted ATPase
MGEYMRCSKCGSDNREGRKFCTNCGASLVAACPKCGAAIQPGESFCGECGTAFGDAVPVAAAVGTAPVAASADGERRHLTVLFCDLVGSTEIAARLDPEEWRDMIAAYHRAAAEAITRFGGYVAKYLGDGVMAYFGWPEAHENDAERAARAGLAILENISKLNDNSAYPKLTARVGIDSGPVVVGVGAGKEADVFGETPNMAARLQATATPGTVLITAATHRLISGLFVVEALGPRTLKGIATPLEVFQVVRPTGVRGRLAAARSLTPLVGREEELRLLLSRWQRVREGEGQLALVVGEAGIGKSRLVAEFHDRIRDTPHIWMESAGEQLFENSPFHALTEMLSQWLQLQALGGAQRSRAKESATCVLKESVACPPEDEGITRLERALASAGLKLDEAVPLIAELLQLPVGERYPALTMVPEQKRRHLFAVLMGWVFGAARLQPVVMVVEDLHWLDPSTLELQQLLAEQGATVPLMLLYAARPEFRAPWPMRAHHAQITLNRLSARNVREMVALVAARNALASESVEAVVERTGGVPLFVEELTRAVLESGQTKPSGREIPVTLHDSLMARLDRLGPAKEVIQVGAVIGSEFSYELLCAVHPMAELDLQAALAKLTEAELLYVSGIIPDATYQFKHALIRDAAYEALLKSRRKELHSRIADVLLRQFPDGVTSAPELLAHHYTEAGLIEQAIPYWGRAGQRATERSANPEAISHFTKGLELLNSKAESPKRIEQELRLQIALGGALIALKGYAAPEAGKAYDRALELCGQVGETPWLFAATLGLQGFNMMRGELDTARQLAEQLLSMAQKLQNPVLLQSAHYQMGELLYNLGELAKSREYLEQAITLYDPEKDVLSPVYDGGVLCLGAAAVTLWLLGYPDQGLKRIREALTVAREHSHPFMLALALEYAVMLFLCRREVQATQEQAEALIELSHEQGFALQEASGVTMRGWAMAKQGRKEEGIAQISQGLAATQALGADLSQPSFITFFAQACSEAGQPEEGLTALAEALDLMIRTRARCYEAELYRLKGELLLMQDASNALQAESCFQQAIEVARKQSAKSLELRATTSLARLLAGQGRRDQARAMLAEIYNWFTEGFDTADLQEAKQLLNELDQKF